MADVYESALLGYKDQLFTLYDYRSELVAKRETLRFRIASAYVSSVNSAVRTISNRILERNESDLYASFKQLFKRLSSRIIVFSTTGASVQLPSVIRDYNNEMFGIAWHPSDPTKNWSVSWDVFMERNNTPQLLEQRKYELDQYERNLGFSIMGKIEVSGGSGYADLGTATEAQILFHLARSGPVPSDPVRAAYIANTIKEEWTKPLDQSGVTMQGIMNEGAVLLKELVAISWDLVNVELQIKEVEVEVAAFLQSYKESTGYVPGVESASLYEELRAISEDLNAKALREVQQLTVPVPDSEVPADPVPVVPAVPEPVATPKKSNVGLIAGLAAAGAIYALTQGEG